MFNLLKTSKPRRRLWFEGFVVDKLTTINNNVMISRCIDAVKRSFSLYKSDVSGDQAFQFWQSKTITRKKRNKQSFKPKILYENAEKLKRFHDMRGTIVVWMIVLWTISPSWFDYYIEISWVTPDLIISWDLWIRPGNNLLTSKHIFLIEINRLFNLVKLNYGLSVWVQQMDPNITRTRIVTETSQ